MDANVDAIDTDDDDDDDAGIFSIANDHQSEEDDALTGTDNILSVLRTERTAVDKDESAEEFLLTREAVVRFVQDSIVHAIDKQKRNADKHGRATVLSFDEGDLVLLSTVNLPRHAVTNVGSSKLLPKYIGPFRVLRRMGNAYTIEMPRKIHTHPTFCVGRLRPYYQYELVSRCEEHLRGREPRPPSSGPVSTSQSGRLVKRPVHAVQRCLDELQPARHEENESNVRSQVARAQKQHDRPNDGHLTTVPIHGSALKHQADPTLEPDQVFPPPPHPYMDSGGGQRFLVERILNHRDVNGVRTNLKKDYLVRGRGYPPAWDSWEPRAQLIVDVLDLVEQHDETHPLRSKKGRRKTIPRTRVQGLKGFNPFGHLGRDARPPVGIIREVGIPRGTVRIVQAAWKRITPLKTG
uniref:Chromo domain-containing protein n=1 Tax=Peronospora matthiolae TaxID=2874970 RepID=A0AAV1V2Y2_9STRA